MSQGSSANGVRANGVSVGLQGESSTDSRAKWPLSLDRDPDGRQSRYRELLREGISGKELASIRQHLGQCKALGSSMSQRQIKALTGRSARLRKPGRPKRRSVCPTPLD